MELIIDYNNTDFKNNLEQVKVKGIIVYVFDDFKKSIDLTLKYKKYFKYDLLYEDKIILVFNKVGKGKCYYKSQKVKGKPYKTKQSNLSNSYYRDGIPYFSTSSNNKGTRHPSSILSKCIKQELNEWFINSYCESLTKYIIK